ncbi:MAG: outer membrane protein assembly factor BamB family protein [Planctomycetota bacterium]|jgi:outer membrane protein assembly factor BamB
MRAAIVTVVATLAVTACSAEPAQSEWPQYRGDAGNTGVSPDTSVKPPLKLVWSYRCDSDTSGDACAGPTVAGGKIFTPMAMGRYILALDAHTGKYLWEYRHRDLDTHAATSYADGMLFVWSHYYGRSTLIALNAETGEPVWEKKLRSSKQLSAGRFGPALGGGKVVMADGGGQPEIIAFNMKDGSEAWRKKLGTADGPGVAAPTIVGDVVFTGVISPFVRKESRTGAAIALSLEDGSEIWRNRKVTVSRPMVSDGKIVVAKFNGAPAMKKGDQKLYALDAATGKILWTRPHWILYSTTAILPDKIVVKNYGPNIAALDRKTGKELWKTVYGGGSGCCSPTVSGKYAYVGTGSFNDSEGEWAWRFAKPPHMDKKKNRQGVCWTFHALDLDTGKSVWHFVTGNNACGDPAIAYGRLYLNSRDGRIYCLEPAKPGEPTLPESPDKSPNASPDAVKKVLAEKTSPPQPGREWPMEGGGPQRVGLPVRLTPPLAKAWEFQTGGRVLGSAAIRGGMVFIGSDSGKVFGLDLGSGAKKWEFETGGRVRCTPAVADGTVYCGSGSGRFFALDAASGKEKWSYRCGGPVNASPAIVGGAVVFGADDHSIYMLDRKTGKKLWRFRTDRPLVGAPPVVVGDTVYAASWHDWVYALDATTGKEKWRSCVPISIEKLHFYAGKLWLRSAYQFCEYDPATGKRLRLGNAHYGYGGLAFMKDVMIYTGAGAASALDLREKGKPSRHAATQPAMKDVMIVRGKGLLGYPRLAAQTTPLVAGDLLCIASRKGEVLLLKPDPASISGKHFRHQIVWSAALGGQCHSSPAAVDGHIVLGCGDGKVYCFRGK